MHLQQLETPCLILDKKKMRQNIAALHKRMVHLGVNLRPHGKTAKNIDILRAALEGQSGGITVSTVKEAEYYFENGIRDMVYAVGIAPVKLDRTAGLIKKGADMTIILDSTEQVDYVAAKAQEYDVDFPVLIEVDCDGHRAGVAPEDPLLLNIGRRVNNAHKLMLRGVLTHAGEAYQCRSVDDIRKIAAKERDAAFNCGRLLRREGLPCPVVSVGSTPTAFFAEDLTGITEVRAGVFIFHDLVMAGLGVCRPEEIAISVLASIIGHQRQKGWVITDAGWMALSRDRGTASHPVDQGYGVVCNIDGMPLPDLIVFSTDQEHGIISSRSNNALNWEQFPIGGQVRILPNHACATAAMHDRYFVTDSGMKVSDVWSRINGW